ncbi:MAG: ABC transporter substrate-binding protein [Spirochaetota bacterium]
MKKCSRFFTCVLMLSCLLCILGGSIISCGDDKKPAGHDPVTLVFWHGIESVQNGKVLNALLERFHEKHPGIHIVPQHYGAADQVKGRIMTAIAGNSPPDLMWWGPQATGQLARAGALVDVSALIKLDESFNPQTVSTKLWKLCTYRDRLYAVPFDTNNLVLYYNKTHFREAGIDPAALRTWKDLRHAAIKLTRRGDGKAIIQRYGIQLPIGNSEWTVWTWQTFLWQAGGSFLDVAEEKARFNSKAGVRALRFWIDLVYKDKSAAFSKPGAGYKTDDFIAGRVSMMINGPWNHGILEEARQKRGLDYGALMLPMQKKRATNVGGENLFMFKTTEKKKKAQWEFAKYVMSEEFQLEWATKTGYLPVNRHVYQNHAYKKYLAENPFMDVFARQMRHGRVRPTIPYYSRISSRLGKELERALYRKAAPEEALNEAAAYANEKLRRMRKREAMTREGD